MKKRILSMVVCVIVLITTATAIGFAETELTNNTAKKDITNFTGSDDSISTTFKAFEEENDSSLKLDLNKQFKAKSYVVDDYNGDFIYWHPDYNFTLYKGEKLYVDFTMYDTWESYYTIPSFDVYDAVYDNDYLYTWSPVGRYLTVDVDSYNRYDGYHDIDSKNLENGKYYIALAAMPCYADGYWADDLSSFEIPTEYIDFYIKTLKKPEDVSVRAGKKKVKIVFNKAKDAQKYEIYRSTSQYSGYKKIATVSGSSYTDKKVKTGKRYYYKIRSKRGNSTTGVAYSKYTTPKRSAKVK